MSICDSNEPPHDIYWVEPLVIDEISGDYSASSVPQWVVPAGWF